MSRFRDVLKGTRALTRVEVAYGDTPIVCNLKPITANEEAEAHAEAVAYARLKGIESPTPNDVAYELALRAGIVARAAVTLDDANVRYFENAAEIVSELDRDRIAMLFEAQEKWQAHSSPRPSAMSQGEFMVGVVECARGEDETDRFLGQLRPVLRASFVRFMASLLLTSQVDKSSSGSTSAPAGTN